MGRKLGLAAAVLAALAVAGGLLGRGRWAGSAPAASLSQGTAAWIIDAGHGGEDGGAVSPGGAVETVCRTSVPVAETVIVGQVPQVFLQNAGS